MKKIGRVIQITGESPSGKSSMALGYPYIESPEDIAVYNFDVKAYPTMNYGFYGSYMHILENTDSNSAPDGPELALVEAVRRDLINAKGKRVVIFDAWEIFAKCLTPYVLKHGSEYKKTVGGGTYARMSILGHVSKIESAILDKLITEYGVEVVFVINHLVPEYESVTGQDQGIRTGRDVPEASKRLLQKSSARFWLKHNGDHPCPIALVVKDPGQHRFVAGKGVVPYRLFPDRLSPFALGTKEEIANMDITLWDIIRHYEENPVGVRPLEKYEKALPEEYALIQGTLSETQLKVWENNQKLALFSLSHGNELIEQIKELGQDNGFVDVFKILKKDHEDLTLAQVKEVLAV